MATNTDRVRTWREANRERWLAQKQEYRRQLRSASLDAYGRSCACCGEATERFLTVDHVNNDGAEQRRAPGGSSLYGWLKKNEYPAGFQTLCLNCNSGKGINRGACPHVSPQAEASSPKTKRDRRHKAEAVTAYGGKCVCCSEDGPMFLTIDHVAGGGKQHRKEVAWGLGGGAFYRWLRDNDFPDGFRLLCWNCNAATHWGGGVCPHEMGR